jgi:hypothetical protein
LEDAMRLVDVVLAAMLLGLVLGYLNMDRPDIARAGGLTAAAAPASGCSEVVCQRLTWLRTPLTHRASYSE